MKKQKEVLYVYDKVCTKSLKQLEIIEEYGKTDASKVHKYTGELGKNFAKRQAERAEAYYESNPYFDVSRRYAKQRRASSEAYSYTPRKQREGGERVKAEGKPLKLVLEKIINLFDSLEERGKNDEWIAKQKAISLKRFYDHKNTIFTALLLVLFLILFGTIVYKTVFVVKTINITGSEKYSDSEILNAAGIAEGDNLYSFSKTEIGDEITFHCPYISLVEVTRTIPNTVGIYTEEDTEMFFADVWGEYLVLSSSLRVLGTTEKGQARENGLVELVLPAVSSSVCGRNIEFVSARDDRYIRSVISTVASSDLYKNGMLDKLDLSDEYDATAQVSGKYYMKIGNESDIDLKLKMAYKTIQSLAEENTSPAKIDLTVVGEASVRFDMNLTME